MKLHVVLSRKWRPQRFSEVVGQDHVITTLQNSLATGRVAHAYLFSGPRGTGKTTVARILAKAVNCLNLQNPQVKPEPCNECLNCKNITSGRTFDVIEMDAASSRGIDQIRDLRENVKLSPSGCRYKVYIIDEVHMLTPEAFNALLKTLEEPPQHVIFILATTEKHKVLETITSRCLQFNFRRLSYNEIADRLKFLARSEGFDIDDEALELIARNADGCLRDAENMLEQMVTSAQGRITAEYASIMLGLGSAHLMDELSKCMLRQDLPGAISALDGLTESGADLTQCLKNLIGFFHDLMLLKINPDLRKLIDASGSKVNEMLSMVPDVSLDRLRRIVKVLMRTERDIKELGYERFNLEAALVEICQLRDGVPIEEALERLEEIEAKIETMPTEMKTPVILSHEPSPVQEISAERREVKPVSGDELREIWEKLLAKAKETSMALYSFMREGGPVSLQGDKLTISVANSVGKEYMERTESREFILRTLKDLLGKEVRLEVIVQEPTDREEKKAPPSQFALYHKAMRDEGVRMVLDAFSGEIVEIGD